MHVDNEGEKWLDRRLMDRLADGGRELHRGVIEPNYKSF